MIFDFWDTEKWKQQIFAVLWKDLETFREKNEATSSNTVAVKHFWIVANHLLIFQPFSALLQKKHRFYWQRNAKNGQNPNNNKLIGMLLCLVVKKEWNHSTIKSLLIRNVGKTSAHFKNGKNNTTWITKHIRSMKWLVGRF